MGHFNFSKSLRSAVKSAVLLAFLLAQAGQAPGVHAAPAFAPTPAPAKPAIALDVPTSVLIGEDVPFTVTFDNPGTLASDTGYGPFVDVVLDTIGADGNDGMGTNQAAITAKFLGAAIPSGDLSVVPFVAGVAPSDPPIMAVHPFLLDSSGKNVKVAAPAGFSVGDLLVTARLPLGSFTPDQPKAELDFKVNMSKLADAGTPLQVAARGGYEFGYTPLNDWGSGDAAWPRAVSGWNSAATTPAIVSLSTSYSGPEDETASGLNFPRQYTVSAEVAPGQTITALDLSDTLPISLQFVSLDSTKINGSPVTPHLITVPSTSTPGGVLTNRFTSVSGTAKMVFTFYEPRDDASESRVIDPASGAAVAACNNASVIGGIWKPVDGRDASVDFATSPFDPAGCEHTLTEKSIAIQKSVTDLNGGVVKPGDVLEYTLSFQVSDFFAFDSVSVTDFISDGQHASASFTPILHVNGNGYTLATAAIGAANYDTSCNYSGGPGPECTQNNPAADDGTTRLIVRVSPEIIARGQNGRLVGGCVNPAGSATPDCNTNNDSATTATIVFRTVVQNRYTNNPGSIHNVTQGDCLTDSVTVAGANLNTLDFSPSGNVVQDDSSASESIERGGPIKKSIYAVLTPDNSVICGPGISCENGVVIKPGYKVTYRLTYALPISAVAALTFKDYLSLPLFDVQDPDANGLAGPAWTFSPTKGKLPLPGEIKLGPADTFFSLSGMTPTLTVDPISNTLGMAYGSYADPGLSPSKVDLLLTVTVANSPTADYLHITNEAHASEASTNAGTFETDAIAINTFNSKTDLYVTITDGKPTYTPGDAIQYTILIGNNGPSDASGIGVADNLPAMITNVSANCVTSGKASCGTTDGSTAISFSDVSINGGTGNTVTITINGTIIDSAKGTLVNTVTVTPGRGQGDPLPQNNSATDTDTFLAPSESVLPSTGFAPNRISVRPLQSIHYADLGDLWLEIPRLGMQAPIVGVPQTDGNWDVTWLGNSAGWLNGTAFPTWAGNSVLTGHVYGADGQPGPFVHINGLWYGDQIIIHAGGGAYVYEVRQVMQVTPGAVSAAITHEQAPWVTLITCRGYDEASNSYLYRVVVRAALVEVR